MKTMILSAVLMLISPLAFAGSGSGSLSCNSGDDVVAIYSFFHSNADSYSTVSIFVKDYNTGTFTQYDAANEEALAPLTVKAKDGRKIKVSVNRNLEGCTVE
jgi:hypothetical protein